MLREYFEGTLPGRDPLRIASRFVSDSRFCQLATPVFLAVIEARWQSESHSEIR